MFSLKFSSEVLWCSPFPLKFKSYNLQHCKKYCSKLMFCLFSEQLPSWIIFRQVHCSEVTLLNKYNNPLLQKSEAKVFKWRQFHKKLVRNQREKKNSGLLRLNQIMSKLLIIRKCLQLPSWKILVPRTSRGRPPPMSQGRPLKILSDHPVDVPSDVPGTSQSDVQGMSWNDVYGTS